MLNHTCLENSSRPIVNNKSLTIKQPPKKKKGIVTERQVRNIPGDKSHNLNLII